MKTLILYQTKTGATKQYAQWIHEDLENSELSTYDEFEAKRFAQFERIIFCMPTYGGQITPKDFLIEHWFSVKEKQVYLLVVGMVPQEEGWSEKSFNTIPKNIRAGLAGYIKLPGITPGGSEKKAGWLEKFFSKLFLGIDSEAVARQDQVKRDDLQRFYELMGRG